MVPQRRDLIAQWAFDTRAILGRFHLWLHDVEERWIQGEPSEDFSFVGGSMQRAFAMSAAVTALGTYLFGRWGEGRGRDKPHVNRVKKDADAVSAYAMSEALWYLSRSLPENHAIMVSLGEGLMPKGGETPEMGSNPMLGFGRVYARPQVAKFVERRIQRLINEPGYEWDDFWRSLGTHNITIWGAAIDTLENTTLFAKGHPEGPLTVLHLFDQPLRVTRPYEGYMGTLTLPRRVVEEAAERSILIDYLTPRNLVMTAIQAAYPDVPRRNVHVWTLGGKPREPRIGALWKTWRDLGAHLVEDGWPLPTGHKAFTESGTYAPTYMVGDYTVDNERHVFILDGYAASAEAIQAASLDPVLDLHTSMCLFSSKFKFSYDRERKVMKLDPEAPDFPERLTQALGSPLDENLIKAYQNSIRNARDADMPLGPRVLQIDDFVPRKEWRVLAAAGYMLPDPYTGSPGVERVIDPDEPNPIYAVTTRVATRKGILETRVSLRFQETHEQMRLVFSPLLDRFYQGQDYTQRAVKISDSGRIRNELQTLMSEALEYLEDNRIKVHFDRVDPEVIPRDKLDLIQKVLRWYKQNHPTWFSWLVLE